MTPILARVYQLTYRYNGKRYTSRAQYLGAGWWIIGTWMICDGRHGVEIIGWSDD